VAVLSSVVLMGTAQYRLHGVTQDCMVMTGTLGKMLIWRLGVHTR
jgi:hypothetical protein